MIRAVVKNGAIHPLDPLPPEWRDGDALFVEQAERAVTPEDLNRWAVEVNQAAALIPPDDVELVASALAEADRVAKEAVRRDMGLAS